MKRKRAIDSAKEFRSQVLKKWQEESQPWPLEGLKQFPCGRTVYVSLEGRETPALLFRVVLKHWKELIQTHGDAIAGIRNIISLIVVPSGEAFCSLYISKFPSLVGQTEAEMIPKVDKSVELLQDFAAQTGRQTATIHNESELVCKDGRRFLLSECNCVNFMSREIAKNFRVFRPQDSTLQKRQG